MEDTDGIAPLLAQASLPWSTSEFWFENILCEGSCDKWFLGNMFVLEPEMIEK